MGKIIIEEIQNKLITEKKTIGYYNVSEAMADIEIMLSDDWQVVTFNGDDAYYKGLLLVSYKKEYIEY